MALRYQVEVTITSAKDLKSVNWCDDTLNPYAIVWVDPIAKSSDGGTSPFWDHRLLLPFDTPIHESTLHIDIVHAHAADDTNSSSVPCASPSVTLLMSTLVPIAALPSRSTSKRPSGRPQGKVDVSVSLRELGYHALDPYYAPPCGVAPPGSRDSYPYGDPPSGYPAYGGATPSYGQSSYYGEEEKSSKFGGMGTGLAVGVVAFEEHITDDVAYDVGYAD